MMSLYESSKLPPVKTKDPPDFILESPKVTCSCCKQCPVAPELRQITNGRCWECYRYGGRVTGIAKPEEQSVQLQPERPVVKTSYRPLKSYRAKR